MKLFIIVDGAAFPFEIEFSETDPELDTEQLCVSDLTVKLTERFRQFDEPLLPRQYLFKEHCIDPILHAHRLLKSYAIQDKTTLHVSEKPKIMAKMAVPRFSTIHLKPPLFRDTIDSLYSNYFRLVQFKSNTMEIYDNSGKFMGKVRISGTIRKGRHTKVTPYFIELANGNFLWVDTSTLERCKLLDPQFRQIQILNDTTLISEQLVKLNDQVLLVLQHTQLHFYEYTTKTVSLLMTQDFATDLFPVPGAAQFQLYDKVLPGNHIIIQEIRNDRIANIHVLQANHDQLQLTYQYCIHNYLQPDEFAIIGDKLLMIQNPEKQGIHVCSIEVHTLSTTTTFEYIVRARRLKQCRAVPHADFLVALSDADEMVAVTLFEEQLNMGVMLSGVKHVCFSDNGDYIYTGAASTTKQLGNLKQLFQKKLAYPEALAEVFPVVPQCIVQSYLGYDAAHITPKYAHSLSFLPQVSSARLAPPTEREARRLLMPLKQFATNKLTFDQRDRPQAGIFRRSLKILFNNLRSDGPSAAMLLEMMNAILQALIDESAKPKKGIHYNAVLSQTFDNIYHQHFRK